MQAITRKSPGSALPQPAGALERNDPISRPNSAATRRAYCRKITFTLLPPIGGLMVAREMRPGTRRSGSIAAAHSTEAVRAQGPGAPTDSRTGRCGCRVPAGGKWLWGSPARCCSAVASAFRRRTLLAHATTDAEASLGVRWRRGTTRWHDRRAVQRVTLMPRCARYVASRRSAEAVPDGWVYVIWSNELFRAY